MCRTKINFLSLFDLDRKLKFWLNLEMVTKRRNRKDHSVSAVFLIYSIFNNTNQISLFSSKVYVDYNDWEKSWGAHIPCLLVSYSYFSTDRQICHVFQYSRARRRAEWRHKCESRTSTWVVSSREPEMEYLIFAPVFRDIILKWRKCWLWLSVGCRLLGQYVASTCLLKIPHDDFMHRITFTKAFANVCPCRAARTRSFEPKGCLLSRFLERRNWTNLQEFPRYSLYTLLISLLKYNLTEMP